MAFELGLDTVQIGPIHGRAYAGDGARRPLPATGTPGWSAEVVATSAMCMGPPFSAVVAPLGWRACIEGVRLAGGRPDLGRPRPCSCDEGTRLLNCRGSRGSACAKYCPAKASEERRRAICTRADCHGCALCKARPA